MDKYNLISLAGIFVLMGFAWLISSDRKNMNWRLLMWGVVFQFVFACFVFLVPAGSRFFLFINSIILEVLDCALAGTEFVFGRLALAPGTANSEGESSLGFFLAFQAFPTIIFFSALMSALYYLRIMPALIKGFAYVFTRFTRISGAESLCASSNIFVGIESALTIKPHLPSMTKSELCTVLTAGMSTVASSVLALYVMALQKTFPNIAAHLISATILSVPAALIMSKIILPEGEKPETLGIHVNPHYDRDSNIFESVINGANAGLKLAAGIVALLIAVLGLVALFDLGLGAVGEEINLFTGLNFDWSLKGLLAYVFYPFVLVMGVPLEDARIVAGIIGERMIVTEVTAYFDLASACADGLIKHGRSSVIAAYALCGFAHVASMAIFIGGIAAIAPSRVKTLSEVALRALIAATLACLMTACIAGAFYNKGIILFSAVL
jgi:concentrative nucleoside transporter, CNT family